MLINLSFLLEQPTGISNYASNIVPYLQSLKPTLLIADPVPGYRFWRTPDYLTPEYGAKGHLSRLLWTQFRVPHIYQKLRSTLFFSPIPEAPLFTKCRSIVMIHDLIPLRFPNPKSPLYYYFRFYIPQVLQACQHIICNSEATAQDICTFWDINPAKITPILLACDKNNFRCLDLPPTKGRPYFIYVGRQDPYKNLHRLIAAFAALPYPQEYELWLVGPSDDRFTPKLQAQTRELGIREQVKFMDYVPREKLPILLNQALALVFPSLWEGFGFPVLEAMACGTPVITSTLASLPEIVGDAGLLINPYQTEAITEAMVNLVEDNQLRARLSQLSFQRSQKFSWAKTGQATLEVLEQYL